MANNVEKINLKIQQLIYNPIFINDNDSDTISNPRSMSDSMNINPSPTTANSPHMPFGLWTNNELFSITINETIDTAYTENEGTKKIQHFEHQLTNFEKIIFIKTIVTDGRILIENKLFVPDVGQLKFRFS